MKASDAGAIDAAFWDRVYSRNEDIVTRTIAGETFLIPIRNRIADMQRIFALNPVAEFIWSELDGVKSLAEVCTRVINEFHVMRETAMTDIAEFIAELDTAALVSEKR
ncbi:MAG: hypothetical protein OHK006_19880 [Thermodesulfovibrionales bacterium]